MIEKSERLELRLSAKQKQQIKNLANKCGLSSGKVIANINVTLAWQLGNVEPHIDALTVGFDYIP